MKLGFSDKKKRSWAQAAQWGREEATSDAGKDDR